MAQPCRCRLVGQGQTIASVEPKREELLAELFGGNGVPPMLAGRLLRTREVAQLFQVSERTVAEWARRGRIPSVRTPGGHRLYPADQVRRLLVATETGEAEGEAAATT
jgi:excisionase family DNA binding protein